MAQKYIKPVYGQKPGTTPTAPVANTQPVTFVFGKTNYQILAVSILLVIIGFVLMSGNTDIYSNTKIVIAPLVVLAGFGLGFYSILKKTGSQA
jgi:hypothetical protein